MSKFNQERCEVCHEPIVDTETLPPDIQEQVYRPGKEEVYNAEVQLGPSQGFGDGNAQKPFVVDIETE
jgi:hypothetical protein